MNVIKKPAMLCSNGGFYTTNKLTWLFWLLVLRQRLVLQLRLLQA